MEAGNHTNGRDRRIPREGTPTPGREVSWVVPKGWWSGEEERREMPAASQEPGARARRAKPSALSLVTWQTALYALVLGRSEEHTSELQSRQYLVCRLLLEKKQKQI